MDTGRNNWTLEETNQAYSLKQTINRNGHRKRQLVHFKEVFETPPPKVNLKVGNIRLH